MIWMDNLHLTTLHYTRQHKKQSSGLIMGIADIGDKISEFRGIKHLFKGSSSRGERETFNGENGRGIAGGPQRARGSGGSSSRSWMKLDEDDAGSHRVLYIVRGAQVFFLLVAIFINAAMAGFQKKWNVGPSGLVIFTFFCAILTLLHSVLCLVVPLLHEKSGRFNSIASALKRPRPAFIINGLNCLLMLIMAFVLTISATKKGCKDVELDAHAELEGYKEVLPKFCRDKRALTAFMWFTFFAWLTSLILTFLSWKRNRCAPSIPAFRAPDDDKEGSLDGDDGSHKYDSLSRGDVPYAGPSPVYETGGFNIPPVSSRQSTTFYEGGRPFDDPTPTGYGNSPYTNPYETTPNYDDPYERIRRERGAA